MLPTPLDDQGPTIDLLNTRPVIPLIKAALAAWNSYIQFGFLLVKGNIYRTRRLSTESSQEWHFYIVQNMEGILG